VDFIAKGDISVFARMEFVAGDVFAMISAMVWAAYSMLLKRAPKGVHPLSQVFVSALIGLCFLTPLYLWSVVVDGEPFFTNLDPAWPDLLKVFYIGAGPAFLGFLFWSKGAVWCWPCQCWRVHVFDAGLCQCVGDYLFGRRTASLSFGRYCPYCLWYLASDPEKTITVAMPDLDKEKGRDAMHHRPF